MKQKSLSKPIVIEGYKLGDIIKVNENEDWIVTNVSGEHGTIITLSPKQQTNFDIMQQHTKNYFKAFNIAFNESGEHDYIACEMCGSQAVDLHHIENRIKGVKRLDHHKNIISLCRSCHEKAHANSYGYTKDCLQTRHENNMRINKIDF